jgi:hypothetical protein
VRWIIALIEAALDHNAVRLMADDQRAAFDLDRRQPANHNEGRSSPPHGSEKRERGVLVAKAKLERDRPAR